MSRNAVELVLYQLDLAFDGDGESLLDNLRTVDADDWTWLPPGGVRTIREIVQHVASCKVMYVDHAFRAGALTWDDDAVIREASLDTVDSAIAWLQEAHADLRRCVAALEDSDLARPRRANWGELKETRWLLGVLINHDAYHSGEINHLRALRRHDDAWPTYD